MSAFENNLMYYSNGSTPFWNDSQLFKEIEELDGSRDSEEYLLAFPEGNWTEKWLYENSSLSLWEDVLQRDTSARYIVNSFIVIICLFGLLGNGIVTFLLGFRIKRNSFTTYILNLSIADFGVLIFCLIAAAVSFDGSDVHSQFLLSVLELFSFTFSTGQFFLVAISVDRSVAVLFPLWHRCHRPPYLSTLVCSLIWIVSFLLSGTHFILIHTHSLGDSLLLYQLIVNALLCTPLMIISSLILFIKVYYKTASATKSVARPHQRGKLVTVILLTLLFFLIFAIPLNTIYAITYFFSDPNHDLMACGLICACLNSSVNPLIYFRVGWIRKKGQVWLSLKMALLRAFKDEEDSMERQKPRIETMTASNDDL